MATERTTPPLFYTGPGEASVFVWLPEPSDVALQVDLDQQMNRVVVKAPDGSTFWRGRSGRMPIALSGKAGIWEVALSCPRRRGSATFRLTARGVGYPFVMPGPGIVQSHFPKPGPSLLFAGKGSLWMDLPDGMEDFTVQAWLSPEEKITCTAADGRQVSLEWRTSPDCAHRTALVAAKGRPGWWRFETEDAATPYRFTVWEGFPLFFEKPPCRFEYGVLSCEVEDVAGRHLDARVEIFRGADCVALRDLLGDDDRRFHLPPCYLTVKASRGIEYAPQLRSIGLRPSEHIGVKLRLRRALPRLRGWACGDLHMHSCWASDGADPPERMSRAARAQGLNFAFISDRPEAALEARRHDLRGRFLTLSGEEVFTPDVHMNALNAQRPLQGLGEAGDSRQSIRRWLEAIRRLNASGTTAALMLNHPSHMPESMARCAYFRSWWVADEFPEICLVENYDFASWFERLNGGRRLTGLWTTDGHDVAWIPPGVKRTYVFVGGKYDERALMEGLMRGRCFNTRHPGAILTLEANGAMMGETAKPDGEDGGLTATSRCDATRPIERVELIADGEVAWTWRGEGSLRLRASARLPATMHWLSARAFVREEGWAQDGHSLEPLMASGCIAFTNPVWVTSTCAWKGK